MSLTELWKTSKEQLKDKQIQQIIAFAGDGHLADQNITSNEFREFLTGIPSDILKKYATECLEESFRESGFALQDIINQVGIRLGFDVKYGRYRGTIKQIGFDGLWRLPNNHAIVVEVKTTDAYRIDLDRIAEYRRTLINQQEISENHSSILIVVGRKETADLEAQIRGSRHAWDIRLISTEALIQLMFLKESLEDQRTIHRIYNILIPREFTRLDEIIEILFSTTEETQQEDLSGDTASDEAENQRTTPKAFHNACIARVEKYLHTNLVKRLRSGYASPDGQIAVTCIVSKTHERKDWGKSPWTNMFCHNPSTRKTDVRNASLSHHRLHAQK
ncbi:MAG: hypothetical protein JXA21_26790 [Anaerolineae bacterium]|nr:hypothetical protein [Anaerolineae bacterium]